MPFYYRLRNARVSSSERVRTVEGLQRLRKQLHHKIPPRTIRDTLLLATWNIRDLGREDKRFEEGEGPGPRFGESYYYIAEIISAFDLVALQEVNTLESLEKIMRYLGPSWEYLTTDTKRGAGGNQERMTFVYDKRKVLFQNVTGQIVLDPGPQADDDETPQFARTPFYAAFQAGWFRFSLCTVHILYGDYKDTTKRVAEIDRISKFLTERSAETGENIILLGDFNILSQEDKTFEPLKRNGWYVPLNYNTNVIGTKAYDQIAFYVNEDELPDPTGGTFDFFQAVFRDEEADLYYQLAGELDRPLEPWDNTVFWRDRDKPKDQQRILTRQEYYETWRTWQISDHFPLWSELKIDFTDQYLERTKAWQPPAD
jgi:endonuclease/exonuclease/phosphatase family metal-dependent hydrolase